MRSVSSDALVSTSFIYVHPASPDEKPAPSWSSSGSSVAGPSKDTVPRTRRREKLFGFTPAYDRDESQEPPSPVGDDNSSESHLLTPTFRDSFPQASRSPRPNNDIPLIPVNIRPSHQKSASTPGPSSAQPKAMKSAFATHNTTMVRKKSGELVRSAIKTEFGRSRDNKPRSEPATPTCPKYVHFDTQLEHVKHFLSQQRPAAVSRSGSPVETETEDEPESFPFPAMATAQAGTLRIKLPNFPSRLNRDQDTYLESLETGADGKSLRGIVRVKNLAFEKWVAVRFTLDNWQTVSEVSAEHHESMGPNSDRFVFSIKLQDLLAKIEEKTMYIAIRYTVGGREIWDNNGGGNYKVGFEKKAVTAPPTTATPKRQTWSVTNGAQAADRMADLRRELDRLVRDDGDPSPVQVNTRSFSDSSPAAFSTRYDFGNSLKMFGGRPSASSLDAPPGSPTKPTSPYATTTYVNGMPATFFPEPPSPATSPSMQRVNLPPDFGASSSKYSPPTYQPYLPVLSAPEPSQPRLRYNSYPGVPPTSASSSSVMTYSPLVPPAFRDHRRRDSPFASPTNQSPVNLSPAMTPDRSPASTSPPRAHSPPLYPSNLSPEALNSPTWSASTASSNTSDDSSATSVPDSPESSLFIPSRPNSQHEFSSFLDRYYFHQNSPGRTPSQLSESYSPDMSTTPRRSSLPTTTCGQYYSSSGSSGSSTPSRDETPDAGYSAFAGVGVGMNHGPAAIVG
ncbi:protein phosphatase 1 [Pseudohyphozyma bogoriensis]|nr:protein phosphatase 1 [Pseudohyphozyma bogoriensis]